MAEEREDSGEKTEEPTQRRLEKAREEGRVAVSREVSTLFLLAAATLAFHFAGPFGAGAAAAALARFLSLEVGDGIAGLRAALSLLLLFAVPVLVLLAAAGIAAPAVQRAIVLKRDAFEPDPSRISPLRGLKRITSAEGLGELVKNLAKLLLAGGVLAVVVLPHLPELLAASRLGPGPFARLLAERAGTMLLAACGVVAVLAGADYAWQRHRFMRSMRMSRQDIREELKESEGDPMVRQRLRALRRERARRRMMADVPKATVVVTNPTHVSVALRYVPGETPAPEVVAKGVDRVALEIRRIAREHGIPLVEKPELARVLYRTVEVGERIPPQLYRAVAEVIARVMQLAQGASRPPGGAG